MQRHHQPPQPQPASLQVPLNQSHATLFLLFITNDPTTIPLLKYRPLFPLRFLHHKTTHLEFQPSSAAMCSADIFLAFLAVLFPPLPVWVKCGLCSADSLINILLCVLGFIPGLLHAWYIIAKYPEPPYEYEAVPQDREGGRVTYVYVQCPQGQGQGQHQHQHGQQNKQPKLQPAGGNMNYGTQNAGGSSQARSAPQQGADSGEGNSDGQGVPPSYADVVAGDNKVQSNE
ncbi:hypothetical protein FZEAL_9132 [Fusarium zealandicum]|uniref:Stress response RCI peptide n=1 Tax=Fusarium zealandicum TaxID=1053134 RepID=A0A8H4XGZ9_9HYPO|nr:hypothetical protein FZEAL_9132 [Fusarium zealandicum]